MINRYDVGGSGMQPWATKADVVYHTLRREILTGVRAPGSVIEQEHLARSMNLSTTPLREGMRRLEAEGLLTQVAHREMRVPELSQQELREVYDVRIELDPFAAQLGTRKATEEDRALVNRLRHFAPGMSSVEMLDQHRQLQRTIYVAAGNRVLTEILDRLYDITGRYRIFFFEDLDESNLAKPQIDTFVEAYLAGDHRRVGKLLRESLIRNRDFLVKRLAEES